MNPKFSLHSAIERVANVLCDLREHRDGALAYHHRPASMYSLINELQLAIKDMDAAWTEGEDK